MKNDVVSHPEHYTFGKIEVIEYIKSTLGNKGCYYFCIGNVIKYVSRAEHKGKQLEDLQKAAWYLNFALNVLKEEEGAVTDPSV